MSECFIRKATTEDIKALRELYLALEKDGVRYQPEHFVIGERTDEFFQTIFDANNQDIFVADIDGACTPVILYQGNGIIRALD